MDNYNLSEIWLGLKPYDVPAATDDWYLQVASEIRDILEKDSRLYLHFLLPEHVDILALFLASWLEDVVSETGIWNSFISMHSAHYDKWLPFACEPGFEPGKINCDDAVVLIWYCLNTMQSDEFACPFYDALHESAIRITKLLRKRVRSAPVNTCLKSCYTLDRNETDFYVVRNFIDTILFKTWLFYTDTLQKLIDKAVEINEGPVCHPDPDALIEECGINILHNSHTRLMNKRGCEWAAKIMGDDHPLSKACSEMSKQLNGYFFYKNQNDEFIFLEHIASSKKFRVRKAFDYHLQLNQSDLIVYAGLVQWMDQWWFSGAFRVLEFDAGLILNEKLSAESRAAVNSINRDEKDIPRYLHKQHQAFIEFNGSSIAFMRSNEVKPFISAFTNYCKNSMEATEMQKKKALEQAHREKLFRNSFDPECSTKKEDFALVFFNPRLGLEVEKDVVNAFPLPNNPYYDEQKSYKEVYRLLVSSVFSVELAIHCIENCRDRLPYFLQTPGDVYLWDIDFLLRFWKAGNYRPWLNDSFLKLF